MSACVMVWNIGLHELGSCDEQLCSELEQRVSGGSSHDLCS